VAHPIPCRSGSSYPMSRGCAGLAGEGASPLMSREPRGTPALPRAVVGMCVSRAAPSLYPKGDRWATPPFAPPNAGAREQYAASPVTEAAFPSLLPYTSSTRDHPPADPPATEVAFPSFLPYTSSARDHPPAAPAIIYSGVQHAPVPASGPAAGVQRYRETIHLYNDLRALDLGNSIRAAQHVIPPLGAESYPYPRPRPRPRPRRASPTVAGIGRIRAAHHHAGGGRA
jgi:hypothetical protein